MKKYDLKNLAAILSAVADGAEWECFWDSGEDVDGNAIPGYGPPLGRDIEYCIANRIAIRLKEPPYQPDQETSCDDGGPAFPVAPTMNPDGSVWYHGKDGMTLRDWFAAAALNSMDYGWFDSATRIREMAAESYQIADAMLTARKEGA